MNIKIEDRSFGGKTFRPQTKVDFEDSNKLLICTTTWGRDDISEKVSEFIKNYINIADDDTEMTMPFARKENLQVKGNTLRMAVIMASEKINADYNKEELQAGFEIFAAIQEGPQWTYVSCGQPSVILIRDEMGIIPLSQSVDLNILTQNSHIEDPLPTAVLGIGQQPPIQYGNLRLRKQDRIALISRSYIPSPFYQLSPAEVSLSSLSDILARDNENIPFWAALLHFV